MVKRSAGGARAALKDNFKDKKIGVLMGGLSQEREISLKTGRAVLKALKSSGYEAVAIDVGRNAAAVLKRRKIEVAFVALHGRYGEDGSIQGLLEVMGVPYTGSGVRASSVAMDKSFSKKVFKSCSIPTPAYVDYRAGAAVKGVRLPYVVKPGSQGSAIGVTVVRKRSALADAVKEAARHTSTGVLIEEYIEGREVTVGIIDGETLPVVEVVPESGLYDFEAKYTPGRTTYLVPAPIAARVEGRVRKVALAAYNALGCAGAARVDVMLDAGFNPFVLEVNTVPGLTSLSLLPMAARAAAIGYDELVERMLLGASLNKC